jgi:hypothetical protein
MNWGQVGVRIETDQRAAHVGKPLIRWLDWHSQQESASGRSRALLFHPIDQLTDRIHD